MNSTQFLPTVLPLLSTEVPRMLVCVVACILILTRWNELGSAAWPAVLGFALAFVLSVGSPIVTTLLLTTLPGPVSSQAMAFTVVRVVLALGWALALGLLATAVIAGRNPRRP
jgi:hypothetical protein